MQLPDSWVKSLFARLQVRYGSAWNRMWDGVDMDAVMADWADELGGFANNPDAIKRALANLPPDRPPTLGQFRAICIGAPGDVHDKPGRLEAPSTSPEVVAAIASAVKGKITGSSAKEWAHRLRRRELACERLTAMQRSAWREALAGDAVSL